MAKPVGCDKIGVSMDIEPRFCYHLPVVEIKCGFLHRFCHTFESPGNEF